METIQIVQDRHVEWRGDGALFLVSSHMDVGVIGAAVGQAMNLPRVRMKGKDDRSIGGKKFIELYIAQTMGMLRRWLELHKVDHVDHADTQLRQTFAQDRNRRQRF